MIIAFIVPWITKSRGGTENVGQMMANAMVIRGHKVHILTFDDACSESKWDLQTGIVLHHLDESSDSLSDSRMLYTIASINPDLIVGLHMNRTFLRYTKCARKLNIPIVLSEHIDPHFPQRINSFTHDERLVAFHGATRIHLLVEPFRKTLPEFMQNKISVVPNTVVEPEITALEDYTDNEKTITTVARLVPRKNISKLIEEFSVVAKRNPEWKLNIIGDGPQRGSLESLAKGKGVKNQVEFIGETKDPYSFLRKTQIFVLPSLFEGFPMSSLEALAHGLPLIGFDICNGINEQVKDGVNGFLVGDCSTPGGMAQALNKLIIDPQMRKRMGEASREIFLRNYSNKIIFDKWEKLFIQAHAEYRTPKKLSQQELLEFKLSELI